MLPVSELVLDQPLHDLVRGQTLGDGEGVLHHLAFDDGVDHVAQAGVPGEAVLAVFQFVLRLEHQRAGDEQPGLVDDAFAHQQIGGVADAAARDVDDLVLGERARQIETLLAEHEGDAADHGDQEDDGEQRVAGDDDRVARALGARGRGGIGTSSGCSAARGLRCAIGLGSIGAALSGGVACRGG